MRPSQLRKRPLLPSPLLTRPLPPLARRRHLSRSRPPPQSPTCLPRPSLRHPTSSRAHCPRRRPSQPPRTAQPTSGTSLMRTLSPSTALRVVRRPRRLPAPHRLGLGHLRPSPHTARQLATLGVLRSPILVGARAPTTRGAGSGSRTAARAIRSRVEISEQAYVVGWRSGVDPPLRRSSYLLRYWKTTRRGSKSVSILSLRKQLVHTLGLVMCPKQVFVAFNLFFLHFV